LSGSKWIYKLESQNPHFVIIGYLIFLLTNCKVKKPCDIDSGHWLISLALLPRLSYIFTSSLTSNFAPSLIRALVLQSGYDLISLSHILFLRLLSHPVISKPSAQGGGS
jgi:hypothetical protein